MPIAYYLFATSGAIVSAGYSAAVGKAALLFDGQIWSLKLRFALFHLFLVEPRSRIFM